MKQKTDESPDQWVRQALSQLTDAPPPGSSFNPDQLWAKLRPELQPVPAPRSKTRLMGWLAAACIGALVFGWGWLSTQSTPEPTVTIAQSKKAENQTPNQQSSTLAPANEPDGPKRVFPAAERPRIAQYKQSSQSTRPETEATPPVSTSAAIPSSMPDDALSLTEAPAIIDKLPTSAAPKVAQVKPKRRFQVVHENELRAEDEAQPKLYRPDHFVRLGTGQIGEPQPEAGRPALIMSLTNKPNQ